MRHDQGDLKSTFFRSGIAKSVIASCLEKLYSVQQLENIFCDTSATKAGLARQSQRRQVMLEVTVKHDTLAFSDGFALNFQRTLRIPDDGGTYPLPPGLGTFPICRVDDYKERVPEAWVEHGGVFIPMYQREALWISFRSRYWKPNAVKVAVGKVNAVSGKPWNQKLAAEENDYLVCPPQPWLDGINAGEGYIRQFVAMPLGMGYTVEAQVTGEETFGGIQIIVHEPKPGRFPDEPPQPSRAFYRAAPSAIPAMAMHAVGGGAEMGLAAGGKMK